jgi:hypothetical protein
MKLMIELCYPYFGDEVIIVMYHMFGTDPDSVQSFFECSRAVDQLIAVRSRSDGHLKTHLLTVFI